MSTEIIIILFLIVANGVFAMSEIAIVSARRIRLQKLADKGSIGAKTALQLAAEPNKLLAVVQFGITLISMITGVFGGNSIAEKLKPSIVEIPLLAPYAATVSLSIVVIIITFLSLIIGELVPKRIGMANPEAIAVKLAPLMLIVSKIGSPFVWILSKTTELILRILGLNKIREQAVTEEEIKALIEEGTQGGHFEVTEQKMVEQVFRMADKRVDELMQPRMEVVYLDVNNTWAENVAVIQQDTHSNYPVCEDSLDNVVGILNMKDLVRYQLEKPATVETLRILATEPLYVPENMRAFPLLEMMREEDTYFALVIDEFGAVQGAVTMNNVLQEIAENSTEAPSHEEDNRIIRREDDSFLIDGMTQRDYFKDYFRLSELPNEDDYNTIAGLIINGLKYIPEVGELYKWNNYRFEVIDMDGNRIDKILLTVD
jgi:putative hemolysin